jgi:predicted metal-dependent phosphoesterase TrpH
MSKKEELKLMLPLKLGRADFHLHSCYSDGQPKVEEILNYVEEHTNLDVVAITDHDTMAGAFEAQELMKNEAYRFELILGEEISSKEGHILGLFLNKEIPTGLPAHEVLKRIKAQEGLAIACHPFEKTGFHSPEMITMDGIGEENLIKEKSGFKGIEIVNATPTLDQENKRAKRLNRRTLHLAETGGSDAHILEVIGKGYTLFHGKSAEELYTAILNHHTRAMHGRWTIKALLKYAFFFLPMGWKLLTYTLLHGRKKINK